jgi:hypothetical protein
LPARGLIPRIRHLGRTMCPGSREETGYLLHPSAEDQKGYPRILGIGIWMPGYSSLAKPL